MKLSLRPKIHNCEKHLTETNEQYDAYGVIEYDVICSVCGKKKNHWAYGSFTEKDWQKKIKKNKNFELPF